MAITFGNTGTTPSQGTATISFNNNGTDIIVFVNDTVNTGTFTYNGVAMTQIGSWYQDVTLGRYFGIFYLAGAASGANNLTMSGNLNNNYRVQSVSGLASVNPVTGFASASGTAAAASVSVTPGAATSYLWGGGTFVTFSAVGADTTDVGNLSGDANQHAVRGTTAGTSALNVTLTAVGIWAFVGVSLNEPAAVTGNFFPFFFNS